MITDKHRIDWLCDRITYLEHNDQSGNGAWANKKGCYWPQDEFLSGSEEVCETSLEDFHGLSLIEYIDAIITREKKGAI